MGKIDAQQGNLATRSPRLVALAALLGLVTLASADTVDARKMRPSKAGFARSVQFGFLGAPLPTTRNWAASQSTVSLSGSTIATVGTNSLVIDEDSGYLVLANAAGEKQAALAINPGAGLLAVDQVKKVAFIADRMSDRLWKVEIADGSLKELGRVKTPAEPFGVALTPDGKTLLVTTIADRKLVGFNPDSMKQTFSIDIPQEARGIAVSHDGREATIAHLNTGSLTHVNLTTQKLTHTTINRGITSANVEFSPRSAPDQLQRTPGKLETSPAIGNAGFAFARNVFATTYLPNGVSVSAYTESTPLQIAGRVERASSYGGGSEPPIRHRVAFVGQGENGTLRQVAQAAIREHSPRAVAYDGESDTLYLGMIGNDKVVAIGSASSPSATHLWTQSIGASGRCGVTGLAIAADSSVRAFCGFSRKITSIVTEANGQNFRRVVKNSSPLTLSKLSAAALRGKEVFHTGDDSRLSSAGAMACASCHPEARNDGLSWRIEGHTLQTPLLVGGRLSGSHPFKWDGKDKNLTASLRNTVKRLGGSGLTSRDVTDLKAYFKTLPAPRTPTREVKAVARGKKLFGSKSLGCATCHAGPLLTNNKSYELTDDLDKVDTPSLIGLAASAPYYHDGSADTLRALLRDKGNIHGMGGINRIKPTQINDLVAYLETL